MSTSRKTPAPEEPPSAAASAILDAAERLAQTRGYNGFSYADIAVQLGVTKAALHYHFASKAALGAALIARYHLAFGAALEAIDANASQPRKKLQQFVELYSSVLSNNRMCLCGMLVAEYATLPGPMQQGLKQFFVSNETWLAGVLKDGVRAGVFHFKESAQARAQLLLGALEGAMLAARSYGNPRRFQSAAAAALADLGGG